MLPGEFVLTGQRKQAVRSVDRVNDRGCVPLLALIVGPVSYLHMHQLVESHGQLDKIIQIRRSRCGRST